MADKRELPRTLPSFNDEWETPGLDPGVPRPRSAPPPLPARAMRRPKADAAAQPAAEAAPRPQHTMPALPLPPRAATIPPPPRIAERKAAGAAAAAAPDAEPELTPPEIVDLHEILRLAPLPVDLLPASEHPPYNSVAPVSMSSIELEEIPDPPRRSSRLAYTGLLSVTFLAALFIYRMQPQRQVGTPAAPILHSPIAAVFAARAAEPVTAPAPAIATPSRESDTAAQAAMAHATTASYATPARNKKPADKASGELPSEYTDESQAKPDMKQSSPEDAPKPAAAEPAVDELPEFSTSAAQSALSSIAGSTGSCITEGNPAATIRVAVTFAPSGGVTVAQVDGAPFITTKEAGCMARLFRGAKVPAFRGGVVTVRKSFRAAGG